MKAGEGTRCRAGVGGPRDEADQQREALEPKEVPGWGPVKRQSTHPAPGNSAVTKRSRCSRRPQRCPAVSCPGLLHEHRHPGSQLALGQGRSRAPPPRVPKPRGVLGGGRGSGLTEQHSKMGYPSLTPGPQQPFLNCFNQKKKKSQ